MVSRREFLKHAAVLSGAAGVIGVIPESIQRAFAIDPDHGTTFLDAEHVVILMQENRSFDHAFGTLRGVRGYNDSRAIRLPNGNPVWLQTNDDGETYGPFRMDIHGTKATRMGSLPHGWPTQVDARNTGRYDKWLQAKASDDPPYIKMPLTMGYYTREDIPFYYSFADAFTICDQHFCSSLTGTTPNRLYLWTGTLRQEQHPSSYAHVRNEEVDYDKEVSWAAFPERLEDHGISWKIYQNEVSIDSGFEGEQDPWLSNFGDNPLEWFTQYQVRFGRARHAHVANSIASTEAEIEALKSKPGSQAQIEQKTKELQALRDEAARWNPDAFEKLSRREKNLHLKAFDVNAGDPDYRTLTTISYEDGGKRRDVQVPKGDVLYQFREDVKSGKLPIVSWLVSSESYSDHPSSAWYGAWYVSEVLDILTQNPEVWKKTIFVLTYDENDGYFDHFSPFTCPHPHRTDSGLVSKGIDPGLEFVELHQDLERNWTHEARESPIGLGFRVPLVVASPWSRGGCVNSQVFDHTSVLQFLEVFLSHKTGRPVHEPNVSSWRRTVCGDLTSIFRPYHGEKIGAVPFPPQDEFIEGIHKAQFKDIPLFHRLTAEEIEGYGAGSPLKAKQEQGTRTSCPLPYELYVHGGVSGSRFEVSLEAANKQFGKKAAGSPFNAYAIQPDGEFHVRSYAVSAGDRLMDAWELADFKDGRYHVRVDGPNGFLREFKGGHGDPAVDVFFDYGSKGTLEVRLVNRGEREHVVALKDLSYGNSPQMGQLKPHETITMPLPSDHRWYDVAVTLPDIPGFERRVAGRIETGEWGVSDPAMAG